MDSKQREHYGKIASIVGVICNLALALGKIVAGSLSGILSVLADGFNNLADCGSSVVALISFKLAAKPADKEHPYGHERIEYIASMLVSCVILLVAFELGREAVGKILHPEEVVFSLLAIVVLAVSVGVKFLLFLFNRICGKKLDSDLLRATATDSISDCAATLAVLVAAIISHYTRVNLDGYMGLIVALIVAWAGIGIMKDTASKLVGQAPSPELIDEVKRRILAHSEVLGIHDLHLYSYGPSKYYASVHIEVDADVNVLDSHELIDEIEREFAAYMGISLTGHLDPVVTTDPVVNELRAQTEAIVKSIDESYSMHDFRVIRASGFTNLIFEVAIPFDGTFTEEEVRLQISRLIRTMAGGPYYPVILVERQ